MTDNDKFTLEIVTHNIDYAVNNIRLAKDAIGNNKDYILGLQGYGMAAIGLHLDYLNRKFLKRSPQINALC